MHIEETSMKKFIIGAAALLISILAFSGCNPVSEKATNLSIVYGIAAAFSFLLFVVCFVLVRKKRHWFNLLFFSVTIVNCGYTFLSVSSSLEEALWANRISYFGSVFLPFSMLMVILSTTNTKYKRWLPATLLSVAVLVFLIAASPGVMDIYYKEVSFAVVNGTSTLEKVYGPLHPIYLVYLLGYFSAMAAVIIRASIKKTVDSTINATIVAIAVFVNIIVWFIEQFVHIDFEILSISYIISELFLLGLHLVMKEQQRLKDLIEQKESLLAATRQKPAPVRISEISEEKIEYFTQGVLSLTPTEQEIYTAYLAGTTTKEIMNTLDIKENTLKFHNKNLYNKLGVSSRKQLVEIYRAIEAKAVTK